jgi:CPA2 family monovalent cation:H+ antiporter-2
MSGLALICSTTEAASASGGRMLLELALILCVAAATTVLFQSLRQPVVLGYLLAGFLVGPSLLPDLVQGRTTLEFLSQLGVILLMYSLGLEFRLRKLRSLGPSAGFVSILEVGLMLWLGFSAARFLGWSAREALFTGGILAISSTTLIRKVFGERAVDPRTRELVTGVLVFEDLIAILLLAALTTVATGEHLEAGVVAQAALRLSLFVVLVLAVGVVFVPRLVRATVALGRRETLLVVALGLCFASAIVAQRAGYSIALGAFLAGSLVAESGHGERVEKLVEPVRDLFVALFFVSVGMLIDPDPLRANWRAGLLLAALVIGGKVLGVSLGAFLAGRDTRSALRAGLCMAQVGEFSFVIAGLGVASGATRADFYPLAVGISTLTAFVSPLLIAHSDRIAALVERSLPARFSAFARLYAGWLSALREHSTRSTRWAVVRNSALVVLLDALALVGLVVAGTLAQEQLQGNLQHVVARAPLLAQSLVLLVVALLCLPPLFGMVRGSRRLGAALASLALPAGTSAGGETRATARRALTAGLQVAVLLAVALPALAIIEPFLPGFTTLGLLLVLALMAFSLIWRSTAELKGQVRAGAQVIADVLVSREPREPAPADELLSLSLCEGVVVHVPLPPGHAAVGRTLAEVGLSSRSGLVVLAIGRGERTWVLPGGNEVLRAGDELSLAGAPEALGRALEPLGLWAEREVSAIGGE